MIRNFFCSLWGGHIAAVAVGAAMVLAQAPLIWWPVGIVGVAVLLWLLEPLAWHQAFVRGWCFGTGLFLAGSSWMFISIHYYGETEFFISLLITVGFTIWMGLYLAIFWGLWALTRGIDPLLRCLVAFPLCWLLGEWLCNWFATGFPWLLLGYGHISSPLGGWAPIGGVSLVSLAAATSGAALYCMWRYRRYGVCTLVLVLFWGGGSLARQIEWTETGEHQPLNYAAIQGHVNLEQKFSAQNLAHIRNLYRSLSSEEWARQDLVVWPETAIAGGFGDNRKFLDEMAGIASDNDTALITGVAERQFSSDLNNYQYYNSALVLGAGKGRYRKRHLVPFGEYVPVEKLLRGLIPFFDLPLSSFSEGDTVQQPLYVKGNRIDVFICYEIAYTDLVASSLDDYGLLLTISEDGWFGDSLAPRQHMLIARMRALETGRELLRLVNSGISGHIDQRGRIVDSTGLGEQRVLTGKIGLRDGKTPYVRIGSQPLTVLAIAIMTILPGFAALRRRRQVIGKTMTTARP